VEIWTDRVYFSLEPATAAVLARAVLIALRMPASISIAQITARATSDYNFLNHLFSNDYKPPEHFKEGPVSTFFTNILG
jgi:hypothetical protein